MKRGFLATALVLLTGVVYGLLVEPNWLKVSHLQVQRTGLHEVLAGKVGVQLSDLHLAAMGKKERRILALIEAIGPDIIFLTGDYVKWGGDYEPALTFSPKLHAPLGVWAVMGDYDYSSSRKSCLLCHQPGTGQPTRRHPVHFLRSSATVVATNSGAVKIVGLDARAPDDDGGEGNRLLPPSGALPSIVLSHDPLAFDDVSPHQNILMLSGDTHGGQVPLPGWFWRLIGYAKNAEYNQGLFRRGESALYVSRGIGTSHVPIRIGRRPELVVLHF